MRDYDITVLTTLDDIPYGSDMFTAYVLLNCFVGHFKNACTFFDKNNSPSYPKLTVTILASVLRRSLSMSPRTH